MTTPRRTVRTALGVVVIAGLAVGATVSCSRQSEPAAGPSPSSAPAAVTIMMDGHTHTISGVVECSSRPARPNATPTEYGNQTTEVKARDDSASVSLSFSDATPPDVNGFAISLETEGDSYQMPFQSPNRVEATRQGKSFTVTGIGRAQATGHSEMRDLQFGVHVTCP